jgi:hypothetical protein
LSRQVFDLLVSLLQNRECVVSKDDPYSQNRSRANLRSPSRSAVGGYAASVKAEPIEET